MFEKKVKPLASEGREFCTYLTHTNSLAQEAGSWEHRRRRLVFNSWFRFRVEFLKYQFDCQHLLVTDVIILLCGAELPGEEGARMEATIRGLGENSFYARVRSVNLHNKLSGRVRENQNRDRCETFFQLSEGLGCSRGPAELCVGRGDAGVWLWNYSFWWSSGSN